MRVCSALAVALLTTVAATPAEAQRRAVPPASGWYVEGFTGQFSSDLGFLDEDDPWGLRLGFRGRSKLGLELNYTSTEGTATAHTGPGPGPGPGGIPVSGDYQADNFDLSVVFHPLLRGGLQFLVFGGAGMALVDSTLAVAGPGSPLIVAASDDSVTVNGGLALKIFLTRQIYIRLDGRARWFEAREDNRIDQEYSAGLGINF